MEKILILGNMMDKQTGVYIADACMKLFKSVYVIDVRKIVTAYNNKDESQKIIMREIKNLPIIPDVILTMKGLEITLDTLKQIKQHFPNSITVNWFFDKLLYGVPLWEYEPFFETIKEYDLFCCSIKGAATKLQEKGFKNAVYLDEAFSAKHSDVNYYNHFQETKYGEDVCFIGNLGFHNIHGDRIAILQHLINDGFNLKIWGRIFGDLRLIPKEIKDAHMNEEIINQQHTIACKSSKVNLGLDAGKDLELGHSARLFRVVGAGGTYLCNYVNNIESLFKINEKGKMITGNEDLVVFYDYDDLVEKLDFLLEHEDIAKKIGENGRKKVLKSHTFEHRIEELISMIENLKKGE